MYRDDGRGQSIQIGAVLLFGALVVALAGYQAFAVPQQNERVEFSHSQVVQDDVQDLRNVLVSTTGEASARSVSVTLGTRYPPRLVAVNPGPPSGTLRTDGTGDPGVAFEVVNAEASGEAGDFWTGAARSYRTGSLVYRPNYNRYGEAPTTLVENTVVVNEFGTGTVALTGQTFVDGNRISLVALNGSLGRTRVGATSVDVRPVSVATTTVSVTNPDSSSPVSLRLPTRLSEDTWRELLDDQLNGPNGHVDSVSVLDTGNRYDTLVVTMETGENYTLELAKVGVGTRVTDTNETYVTTVTENGTTVPTDGRTTLTVEVRDSYDNPVGGVTVRASPSDGSLTATERTTGGEGRATFTLKTPSSTGTVAVNFSYEHDPVAAGPNFDSSTAVNATLSVVVQDAGAGSGSSSPDYTVEWRDAGAVAGSATNPATSCSAIPCGETFSLGVLANPAEGGKLVSYYSNDSSVATLSPTVGATDSTGEHETTLELMAAGDVLLLASNTSGADELLVDTFVESTFESNADDWTQFGSFQGGMTGRTDQGPTNRGDWSYRIDGGNPGGIRTAESYDTSDAELITVEYWAQEVGPDSGNDEDLVFEYLVQGGNPGVDADWQEFDRLPAGQDGTDEYLRRARLTSSDAFHGGFRVRIRQIDANGGSDEWYVDDVIVRSVGPSGANGGGGGGGGDTTAPTVSSVSLSNDGSGNLAFAFDSDEQLSTVSVSVDGPNTANVYTFDGSDFSESGSGPYTYTLTTTRAFDDGDGTYTATVDDATDSAGNNGGENGAGTGLSDDYDYSSGPTRQRDPGFAYADVNDDGLYSSADGDFQVDVSDGTYDAASNGNSLVIPDSVSAIDASSVSFEGRNVYVGTDVTSSGSTTLEATAGSLNVSDVRVDSNGGSLSLTGPTINATGSTLTSAGKVTVSGSASTNFTDATVRSEGPGQELKVSGSGSLTATDATLTSEGAVTMTPSGVADVDGATVEARGGSLEVTGSSVRGLGATLDSDGSITAKGNSGEVRFTSATLDVVDGTDSAIALTSSGEMYLDSAELVGDSGSSFTGSRQTTSNTLYVDAAVFRRGNGASKNFDVSPGSRSGGGPAGVNGSPQKGTVV